ncbi:MAG: hypothetical protein DYG88_17420 [Chloroflexi bacterium CFX4]|nr:hypothetical protein [Chloroflexi bacterium CFX4]MDL1924281.1 hypothetical protein [Chloroflexi bacterium CFX3]
MRRFLPLLFLLIVVGCGSAPTEPPVPPPPTRSAALAADGARLPSGSLIMVQNNQRIALLPEGRSLPISDAQFGVRGAPNGRYGVAFAPNGSAFDLLLIDYGQTPPEMREIAEGQGLINPVVTWQADSSGFAFYDFPLFGGLRGTLNTLYYYRISDGQSRALLPSESISGGRAAALAFSPNGIYLLYAVLSEDTEAIGAQSGAGYLLNLLGGQPIALAADALLGFSGWLGDSSGFLTVRDDPQSGRSIAALHRLTQLATPIRLTPEDGDDTLIASAPDGSRLVVASRGESGGLLSLLSADGSGRQVLHRLAVGQSISALLWAEAETIYFSVSSSEGDQTWRMAPDGSTPTQIAEGVLQSVVR